MKLCTTVQHACICSTYMHALTMNLVWHTVPDHTKPISSTLDPVKALWLVARGAAVLLLPERIICHAL